MCLEANEEIIKYVEPVNTNIKTEVVNDFMYLLLGDHLRGTSQDDCVISRQMTIKQWRNHIANTLIKFGLGEDHGQRT